MSINLNPTFADSYAIRADIYTKQGKLDLSEADYRKIIEIEDSPEKNTWIPYAYLGLGEKVKALSAMDSILAGKQIQQNAYLANGKTYMLCKEP